MKATITIELSEEAVIKIVDLTPGEEKEIEMRVPNLEKAIDFIFAQGIKRKWLPPLGFTEDSEDLDFSKTKEIEQESFGSFQPLNKE